MLSLPSFSYKFLAKRQKQCCSILFFRHYHNHYGYFGKNVGENAASSSSSWSLRTQLSSSLSSYSSSSLLSSKSIVKPLSSHSCLIFTSKKYSSSTTTTNKSDTEKQHPSQQQLRSPTMEDVQVFEKIMNFRTGSVITTLGKEKDCDDMEEILKAYNVDWTHRYQGNSPLLLRPKTTNELSSILSHCHKNHIGIVPQGGNTSLVGGSTPTSSSPSQIILSLEKFSQIHSFDTDNGILTCDAGCILSTLQTTISNQYNYLIPVDIGSRGSCQIGGNVSTNAGGQYYYRFGSLHANVLGLEVVTADGTVLDLMSCNRKDNTGYDLKHLFIGAEGTLGIITKIALSCPKLPTSRQAAILVCPTFQDVRTTLSTAKEKLGEVLSAFEFMDQEVISLVRQRQRRDGGGSSTSIPLDDDYDDERGNNFYLLVETQGSNDVHDNEKMEQFLEGCMESGFVVDGVLAQDGKQIEEMWSIRESANPVVKADGYNYKYDISIPIPEFYDMVEEMKQHLTTNYTKHPTRVSAWGHVIDGNLHLNITTPGIFTEDESLTSLIEPYVFEEVVRRNGSISAEHGLGQCKNNYLTMVKDPSVLALMKSIKSMLDPNGIMNPGKFLPTTTIGGGVNDKY